MMNNKLGTAVLCMYIILSIMLIPVLAMTGNMELAGMDITLAFIVVSIMSIKYSHGLDLKHLFLGVGIIGFCICSIFLFFPTSNLSLFIKEYGMLLVPISFIIVPIYSFIIIPKSQYSNIMKTNPIETIGTCIDYASTASQSRNRRI